jgi:transcriptional regulator with XRE-family HTH domain
MNTKYIFVKITLGYIEQMNSLTVKFASNLKRLRKDSGLTQPELAEKTGIALRTYAAYEYKTRFPGPDVIDKLAEALGVDLSELFTEVTPPETNESEGEPKKNGLAGVFGRNIKDLRKSRGLTQAQLAEELDMGQATIQVYELGKRFPGPDAIDKIAEFFGVDPSALFSQDQDQSNSMYSDKAQRLELVLENMPQIIEKWELIESVLMLTDKDEIEMVAGMARALAEGIETGSAKIKDNA